MRSLKNVCLILGCILIIVNCNRTSEKGKSSNNKVSTQLKESNTIKEQKLIDTFCFRHFDFKMSDYQNDTSGIFGYYADGIDHIIPNSVSCDNRFVYILDQLNMNVIKINVNTFESTSSMSTYNLGFNMLFDILALNNKIYCSTICGKIIRFNDNLEIEIVKKIASSRGYLYKKGDSQFEMYTPPGYHDIYCLNEELDIISKRYEDLRKYGKIRSYKIKDNGLSIETDASEIFLNNQRYNGDLYGEKNVAYSDSILTFFQLDTSSMNLRLYIGKKCE